MKKEILCNVVNIRGEERIDAFNSLKENDEIQLEVAFGEKDFLVYQMIYGDIGNISKTDALKCFEIIAELHGENLDNIFAWDISYTAHVQEIIYEPAKLKILIEFSK